MILYYYDILAYYWLSTVKHQFMAHWQQWFYDPLLASAATKHTQWRTRTTEMVTYMTTETKTETTRTMPLPYLNPMVWSLILSWCLVIAEYYWWVMTMSLRPQRTIYIPFLNVCHKLLCAKFGVLDWCRCHMKKYQFS